MTLAIARAALLVLLLSSPVLADAVSQMRSIETTLNYNEREFQKIARLKVPAGVSPKISKVAKDCVRLAEKCLVNVKHARLAAKRIELGDQSEESIQLLNHHMHQMRLIQTELEQRTSDLQEAVKPTLP